ncbi:hypothetical protein [Candidatus Accumulibacter cognatus]|uniref:Uncharacterized protein n=1 Tax=Candidatus Accumulibacter cognatus TaxID=2954383 RepID=A0A080MIN8_9PROT|nr:hypothetical protein [Candidatus Accumulibacter cognatus]KFB77084.1 MAG: hypothetical protein AW06_001816 [Candidatus Accumulibacter cognatus]
MPGLTLKRSMGIGRRRHCAPWVAVLLVLPGGASGEPTRIGGTLSALGTMKIRVLFKR